MCVKLKFLALIPQNELVNKCHPSLPNALTSISCSPFMCKEALQCSFKTNKKAKDSFQELHMDLNLLVWVTEAYP